MANGISVLKPLGYQKKGSCGYCHNDAGSSSYYLRCDNLRVDHYQELVDRGWRRSGTLYYKPDLRHSCCPQYTIRVDAAEFRSKRGQRKAVNQWNRHVLGPEYIRNVKILAPLTREEKRQRRDKFDLLDANHLAEYSKLKRPLSRVTKAPIEPAHKFEVSLESDAFTKEKYEVFLRYQMIVHKDPKSRWGHSDFKRFLCGGLDRNILRMSENTQKVGSYHHCYRIDGKLVAVGALDLLPQAVSSVYLFYDPDYEQWEFGKISALKEIALAIEGHYKYYYMDPENLSWDLLDDEFRKKLDERSYVSLSGDRCSNERNGVEAVNPGKNSASEEGPNEMSKDNEAPKTTRTDASARVTNLDDLEEDSQCSDGEEAEIPEGSLFEYGMPGILQKSEVEKLDLNHWKLIVRNAMVDLEDLRGWDDWKIDDPYSIKGIAAELAAAIGPNLLSDTAISLF